jgi:hypothetical protein
MLAVAVLLFLAAAAAAGLAWADLQRATAFLDEVKRGRKMPRPNCGR